MTRRVSSVHVKKKRGKVIVYGVSSTPRGTRIITDVVELKAPSIASADFKNELIAAVDEIMA